MLTYGQVHLYFLFPPICVLLALYWPLVGRRNVINVIFLWTLATLYTTPWDNWIISQAGWGYPPESIIGQIYYVPLEEHLFFLVQPLLLILLQGIFSHSELLPFRPLSSLPKLVVHGEILEEVQRREFQEPRSDTQIKTEQRTTTKVKSTLVQTLPRRNLAALPWVATTILGGILVNEAQGWMPGYTPEVLRVGRQAFYLGWILVWICPVIAWLTWLGGRFAAPEWKTLIIGGGYLCIVDTIAIRAGAWSISPKTSLCVEVTRGLPIEEFIFFILVSYLCILSTSIATHIHTLLLLSPDLPPCPPLNPVSHVLLLAQVALDPPLVDLRTLEGLVEAEATLKKGSKSFSVAKLAFGREMRIGLIAIYAWCRVTDNLIDEIPVSLTDDTSSDIDVLRAQQIKQRGTLFSIRSHLSEVYKLPPTSSHDLDRLLDRIPHLDGSSRSAFHVFASIVPRLVPIEPFMELCDGYETDMAFITSAFKSSSTSLQNRLRNPSFDVQSHLPIKTTADLVKYADNVAGSIASAICYLSWSILTSAPKGYELRPVDSLSRSSSPDSTSTSTSTEAERRTRTVAKAREMGIALQLVNIARDVAKDVAIGRIYCPLSSFQSASALLDLIFATPNAQEGRVSYKEHTLPLLAQAEEMRAGSAHATRDLPGTARAGARAMTASYFEISNAIKAQGGEIDDMGVKVSKASRAWAAARAFWGT